MRLVKTFGLAALAAVAAMAFVGAGSAPAETSTQLCTTHTGLTCGTGASSHHMVLASGTVGKLLSSISVLCLSILIAATPLGLANPQSLHTTSFEFTGCGTSSTHNNCTITVQEQPLANLLKTGLDVGVLAFTSGRLRTQCPNLGQDCVYDGEGMEFSVGSQHLTAEETPAVELGGKFFCPEEGFVDGLFETLTNTYVLE